MKKRYIELMEKVLSAYTNEHIQRYFDDVKTNGLTEHGFPRLTANIGILIAYGRRLDLFEIFIEMMDFCCKTIPNVKAANDFSVREIISCLFEVEQKNAVPKEKTEEWRANLATIEPLKCYNVVAKTPTDTVRNWALFTALSEYFRQEAGLCDSTELVELQLEQQLQWLDENGMYMDHDKHEFYQPVMYDIVPRGLFSIILNQGYRGRSYKAIDEALRKAGLLMLGMQSPNGEMAFGGRSNQFLHNEPWMIAVLEFEAKRYAKEGNMELAAKFKAASARALAVTEEWLDKKPLRHIKNRFPTETKYGCEQYAYFDKYMITAASNLYAAYLICDDSIPFEMQPDHEPCIAKTSHHFHKLFAKAGGYGLEFDLNARLFYDANGLGRVHREGAPSAICLSTPCPFEPGFTMDIKPFSFSICSAVYEGGEWLLGAADGCKYEILDSKTEEESASVKLLCRFENGKTVEESYIVDKNGVEILVKGEGKIGLALPAFCFDGEKSTEIVLEKRALSISYEGWTCKYTADSDILDLGKTTGNRNGHYRAYLASGENELSVKIEIFSN